MLVLAAWLPAYFLFRGNSLLLGSAFLAFTLGLRHGLDADHIAAIDAVTRKLFQEGKRPGAVGLFFSLGHSTIVAALSLAVALATTSTQLRISMIEKFGGIFGLAVSSIFLLLLAAANFTILFSLIRSAWRLRAGSGSGEELHLVRPRGGLFAGLFGRLFRLVARSRHMYLVGLLFGLGFDTATEIALLGLSAIGAAHGLSVWAIMVFPATFAAGMILVDSADTVFALSAIRWTAAEPLRRIYYNIAITMISGIVALLVSGAEALGFVQQRFRLGGLFWNAVELVNANFTLLGCLIIGVFAAGWAFSALLNRLRRPVALG